MASAGFEPANLGTKGQHAAPRPPKPQAEHDKAKSHFSQFCIALKNMYVGKLAETIFVGKSALCGCDPPDVQALFTCT